MVYEIVSVVIRTPCFPVHLLCDFEPRYSAVITQPQVSQGQTEQPSVCQREKRALITLDTDFADIRAYPPQEFPGLIVLRLHGQEKTHVLEILDHLMRVLSSEPLEQHLWIVEETRIRIRG